MGSCSWDHKSYMHLLPVIFLTVIWALPVLHVLVQISSKLHPLILTQTLQLFVHCFISVLQAATQFSKLHITQDCHLVVRVDEDSHSMKLPIRNKTQLEL